MYSTTPFLYYRFIPSNLFYVIFFVDVLYSTSEVSPFHIIFQRGYDCDFNMPGSHTILQGCLTVRNGGINAQELVLR